MGDKLNLSRTPQLPHVTKNFGWTMRGRRVGWQLDDLSVSFLSRNTLDTTQIVQFIYRKASFKTPDDVHLRFLDDSV
jgi:hypothetical protein